MLSNYDNVNSSHQLLNIILHLFITFIVIIIVS